MIIRGLTVSLLFAVFAVPAYAQDSAPDPTAQDNPQTRQTDEAEDDYRRSQRRRDTGDIFDDIDINTSGSGGGGIIGREVKAIDRLDQDSRRHLNKLRAKALAEAQPGELIDAAFEPSDVAKSDEYVAKQEERAWEEMMRDANSGLSGMSGQGTGIGGGQGGGQGNGTGDQTGQGQPNGGQAGQQGQAGQGQSGQGQGGTGSGQSGQPNNSPLRGGSASSASSILEQLRGRSGSGGGTAPQTGQTAGSGQAPSGQAPSGQAEQSGQANQDETRAQGQDQAQPQATAQSQNSSDSDVQSASDAQAQAAADANAPNAAAEAAAHRETISPLERLKRDPLERDDIGGRTSASDYLNRGKD